MLEPTSLLTTFDARLADDYRLVQQQLAGQPAATVQRRFAESALFPRLGWPLLGDGIAAAVARQDPALAAQVLVRLVCCAHATWGHAGPDGIHYGGFDHCALALPAVHSAPLGLGYLLSVFPASRKPSVNGHGPLKHAANLMLCLAHPGWPHRPRVLKTADAFAAGKSGAAVDKAFVSFFLALLAGDAAATAEALVAFHAGYVKSDWGRYKPLTRGPFMAGLVALADAWGPAPVTAATRAALFTPAEDALWVQLAAMREAQGFAAAPFAPPLDFLNDAPGLGSPVA